MSIRVKRMLAGLVDFYILCFAASLVVAVATLGKLTISPLTVMIYLLAFILLVMFQDYVFKNASVGKKLLNIKIVSEDNHPLTVLTMVKRNLPKVLIPVEIYMIFTQGQRLGDIWSRTTVVSNKNP